MSYSERLPITGSSISEALDGSLPPVEVMTSLLYDKRNSIHPSAHKGFRVREVIKYSQALHTELGLDDGLDHLSNPKRDIVWVIYLDSIRYLGESYFSDRRLTNPDAKKGPRDFDKSKPRMLEREILQNHLEKYEELFKGSDPKLLYEGLETIAYDAACLLFDYDDLNGYIFRRVRGELTGLLAEYKVVQALKENGFPLTRYSSPEQDFDEAIDIIVPIGEWHRREAVYIQVKARSEKDAELSIDNPSGTLLVGVPMHRDNNSFRLAPLEVTSLIKAVDEARSKTSVSTTLYN